MYTIPFRFGRIKILVVSFYGVIVVTFLSAFLPNFALFATSRFIVGIFKPATVLGPFVIAGELVGPKYRAVAVAILWIMFIVAMVVTGLKAYFIRKWKMLMIACSAPYFFVCFLVL